MTTTSQPGDGPGETTGRFVGHFLAAYPRRSILMVTLLVLAGLAQGFGIVALLPLLDIATGEQADEGSLLRNLVQDGLAAIGLEPSLGALLVVITVAIALRGLLMWLAMREVGYTVARVAADLRLRFIRALSAARWRHFASQPSGHVANSLSQEANRASWAIKDVVGAMAALFEVLINLIVVLVFSWRIGLLSIGAAIVVGLALSGLIRMSRRAGKEQTKHMRSLIGRLSELLPAIKPVKAMHRESGLIEVLERNTRAVDKAQRDTILAYETMSALREPILTAVLCGGLFIALRIGGLEFSAVLLLAILFYRVMTRFGDFQSQYQTAVAGESAFWSVMRQIESAEAERETHAGTTTPPTLQGGISLRSIDFAHSDTPVLVGVDLTVPAKKLTVVTGASGIGKSTLVDLIAGLHQPDSGAIEVDGIRLDNLDMGAWRRTIGYVPQDVLLLNDTVFENVVFGETDVTRDAVRAALAAADALDFVERLPGGIDHAIGERGSTLSGGQQQRLAIARALVHDPQLLLLDEATSALDGESEAGICRTLQHLAADRTIIAVAHRGAITDVADVIVELADRRAVVTFERNDGDAVAQRPDDAPTTQAGVT